MAAPPLPTVRSVLDIVPALLAASGELGARSFNGRRLAMRVVAELNPAFANVDLDPDLSRFSTAEQQHLRRQRRRTFDQLDQHFAGTHPWPWVLGPVPGLPLAAPDWKRAGDPTGLLHVDVPLITSNSAMASLSGQRHGLEDFAYWLRRQGAGWVLA